MSIIRSLGNFLFPEENICFFCREYSDGLICNHCQSLIEYSHREINLNLPNLDKVYYSVLYNRFIREKIHAFKFNGKNYLYKPFGEILLLTIYERQIRDRIDVISFVPIHRRKNILRGYNQSQLVAEYLAKKLDKPLLTDNLIKVKWTKDQNTLGKMDRSTNLKNSFKAVNINDFKSKKILLIDDIITTGATMEECSKVLRQNGAKKIYGLAITSSMKIG